MEEESSSNDSVMEKSSDVEGAQSVDESLSERGAEVDRISYAQLTVNIDENSGKSVSRFSDSQNAAVSSDMEGDVIRRAVVGMKAAKIRRPSLVLVENVPMKTVMKSKQHDHFFLPQLSTPTADKGNRIPASTFDLVAGAEKDIIYMPLNINGTHWVCLVVDKIQKTIHTYDSFDKRATQNLLGELAEELNKKCFPKKTSSCGGTQSNTKRWLQLRIVRLPLLLAAFVQGCWQRLHSCRVTASSLGCFSLRGGIQRFCKLEQEGRPTASPKRCQFYPATTPGFKVAASTALAVDTTSLRARLEGDGPIRRSCKLLYAIVKSRPVRCAVSAVVGGDKPKTRIYVFNAKNIYRQLYGADATGFEASSGWLARFKTRRNLVSRRQTTTRSLPVDAPDICRGFIQRAQYLITKHGIKPKTIINMDQVPQYFETEPKSTITTRGSREVLLRKGGSSHKRFTAAFAITGEEEFLKPHLLFRYAKKQAEVPVGCLG
ncbi:hypothetical protein F444_11331 [Phytophthora nicotianae P1976]|uniref:Ubiquitin-like protease family profile domain-containing protein n=1 Tax=Phytophthora nicotianae P1976 TaxID=1317066 RepID=A0A081A173_PHYNI|nr:hypothetical protein F444_11331 [Phytophthora nicotianae P1976]